MNRKGSKWIGVFCLVCLVGWAGSAWAVYVDEARTLEFVGKLQTRTSIRLQHSEGFTHPHDIAAGNVYYAAPDWKKVPMAGKPYHFNRSGYSDAFLCFADDIDRDGVTDLIAVGFPGQKTHWLRNPGKVGAVWSKHLAVEQTGSEQLVTISGEVGETLVIQVQAVSGEHESELSEMSEEVTLRVLPQPGGVALYCEGGLTEVAPGWWSCQ